MIGLDTNLLLAGIEPHHAQHAGARRFLESIAANDEVVISEFVLAELYGLLRNDRAVHKPLDAGHAAATCQAFRRHPRWRLFGFPPDGPALHDRLWQLAANPDFSRRRIYDARLALSLVQQGVTEFATVNVKDFQGLGFNRVWNPL